MILYDLKKLYRTELSTIYNEGEVAELSAIFFTEILGLSRIEQRRYTDYVLNDSQTEGLTKVLNELKTGKPYQQILGKTEFYGLSFKVTEAVLVPRPETEELLELAIEKIRTINKKEGAQLKVLDIGTGSGVIPIVLKKHFVDATVSAIDFSDAALSVARENAAQHKVDINFIHADYLNTEISGIFDVIISNPPYIGQNEKPEISDSVKNFEPEMALFSPTENALIFYEKIAWDCKKHLAEGGMVFMEINQKMGPETCRSFEEVLTRAELVKDISGNDRMVWGIK